MCSSTPRPVSTTPSCHWKWSNNPEISSIRWSRSSSRDVWMRWTRPKRLSTRMLTCRGSNNSRNNKTQRSNASRARTKQSNALWRRKCAKSSWTNYNGIWPSWRIGIKKVSRTGRRTKISARKISSPIRSSMPNKTIKSKTDCNSYTSKPNKRCSNRSLNSRSMWKESMRTTRSNNNTIMVNRGHPYLNSLWQESIRVKWWQNSCERRETREEGKWSSIRRNNMVSWHVESRQF